MIKKYLVRDVVEVTRAASKMYSDQKEKEFVISWKEISDKLKGFVFGRCLDMEKCNFLCEKWADFHILGDRKIDSKPTQHSNTIADVSKYEKHNFCVTTVEKHRFQTWHILITDWKYHQYFPNLLKPVPGFAVAHVVCAKSKNVDTIWSPANCRHHAGKDIAQRFPIV